MTANTPSVNCNKQQLYLQELLRTWTFPSLLLFLLDKNPKRRQMRYFDLSPQSFPLHLFHSGCVNTKKNKFSLCHLGIETYSSFCTEFSFVDPHFLCSYGRWCCSSCCYLFGLLSLPRSSRFSIYFYTFALHFDFGQRMPTNFKTAHNLTN